MVILAIDTAMYKGSVALLDEVKGSFCVEVPAALQAEQLFTSIQSLLNQADLTYPDITILAVTKGPGSFTGLRIGLAAAKGLKLALRIPLFGLNTLEVIAWSIKQHTPALSLPVVVVQDAGRDQFYHQCFSHGIDALTSPVLVNGETMLSLLPKEPFILTGNAVLTENFPTIQAPCKIITLHNGISHASALAFAVKHTASTLPTAVGPLYIREPDAKVKQVK